MSPLALEKPNLAVLKQLRPPKAAEHLAAFCDMPCASEKEKPRTDYIVAWAEAKKEQGFTSTVDNFGNVSVFVPASKGFEHVPRVLLNGHIDMVFAPEGHNFDANPMQLENRTDSKGNELIAAKGTTAGFDNGVGCATMMAYAEDPDAKHGPMTLFFTIDEEENNKGAKGFNADTHKVSGVQHVISLDGNDHTRVIRGAASFQPLDASLQLERETEAPTEEGTQYDIVLSDLPGGHSGLYRFDRRGSAMKVLSELLKFLPAGWRLISVEGGTGRTAIPSSAKVRVHIPGAAEDGTASKWLSRMQEYAQKLPELHHADADGNPLTFNVSAAEVPVADQVLGRMTEGSHRNVISLLQDRESGVASFTDSGNIEDPATSVTIGRVGPADIEGSEKKDPNRLQIRGAVRSALPAELRTVATRTKQRLSESGCEVELGDVDPGYEEPAQSPFLTLAIEACEKVLDAKVDVEREHGFLELGYILRQLGEKCATVVIGAKINGEHKPGESVQVDSVEVLYRQLDAIMTMFAERSAA